MPWRGEEDTMNKRKALIFLALGFCLILPGGVILAQAAEPGSNSESILGSYYFKSIAILEIRQEGDSVVTVLPWERDFLPDTTATASGEATETTQTRLPMYWHRGRLADLTSVEFGPSAITLNEALVALEITGIQEKRKGGLDGLTEALMSRRVERWKLLPGGHLEIDSTFPIIPTLNPNPSENTENVFDRFDRHLKEMSRTSNRRSVSLDTFRQENPALCKQVCGFKIKDDSELAAWKALDAGKYDRAVKMFQEAAQRQPGWPFPLFGEAWAHIGTSEFDLARRALRNGRATLTPEYRSFLEVFAYTLEDQIHSYELVRTAPSEDYMALSDSFKGKWVLSEEDRDLMSKLCKKSVRAWTPQDRQVATRIVQAFPLRQDIEKAVNMRGRGPLLPIGTNGCSFDTLVRLPVPSFLEQQCIARVSVLAGHLSLSRNDVRKAISLHATPVHLGQMFRHGTLISHLVGIAMEDVGLRPLLDLFEDGRIQDSETLAAVSDMSDQFLRNEIGPELARTISYELRLAPHSSDPVVEYLLTRTQQPNLGEVQRRLETVRARLLLLKTACAVKGKSLKPPFPAQLDAAELPEDPFAKGEKLRYVSNGNGGAVVYSLGPDQKDDRALIPYDPTNGTVSAGDILVRIR